MDQITASLLKKFVESQELELLEESQQFERFCNLSVLSKEYSDTFDVEDVSCGKGNDTGLDGVAIIVNGRLITSEEEVEDLIKINGFLDAKFVFVQTKTSGGFDSGEIGNFCFGVKDFFSETPQLIRNEFITKASKVKDYILENSDRMTNGNPICRMYYVTTGTWQEDANLKGRIAAEKSALDSLIIFSEVEFFPVDAIGIQRLYRQSANKVSVTFNFPSRVLLPDMDGVVQAFIGVLPAADYIKIISDENDEIRSSIFYLNVRDFQDYNAVNKGIQATLQSSKSDKFAILNNGVTLVARDLKVTRDNFHIIDFQIVNGCQTSHVLFNARKEIIAGTFIPLKVIHTTDDEVTNNIIKSTNRQTAVKEEDLSALTDFEKQLESLYNSFEGKKKLFYERRPKQYAKETGVAKVNIVTRSIQIKAFASMFLEEPHRAGRYYGTLARDIGGKRLFSVQHKLMPYYVSGFANHRLDFFFRNGSMGVQYKPFRYHLLLLCRILSGNGEMPALNANKMETYCNSLSSIIWSDEKLLNVFQQSVAILDQVGIDDSREVVKTQAYTDKVKSLAYAEKSVT